MNYPVEVPILRDHDFCKGGLHRGDQCCVVGWGGWVFGGLDEIDGLTTDQVFALIPKRVRGALARAFREIISPTFKAREAFSFAGLNDSDETPNRKLAKAWNRAMAHLGYTEGNPEAKYV